MVTITLLNDLWAQLSDDFDDASLDAACSFTRNKFWFKHRAAQFGWDGKTRLYLAANRKLPVGLVPLAKRLLRDEGHAISVVDKRASKPLEPLGAPETLGGGITLRPEQKDAINAALGHERGVIWAATGSGKSEIGAGIIRGLGSPRTLVLVGRRTLARQMRQRLALRLEREIGYCGEGTWAPQQVTVAMLPTLMHKARAKARDALLQGVELLIIDEAHHAGSQSWFRTIMSCPARYRIGLTGTPIGRSDSGDLMLQACTGGIIARISAKELIDRSLLAKPTIWVTPMPEPRVWHGGGNHDWLFLQRELIEANKARNASIVDYAKQLADAGKQTLILVGLIAHGKKLAADLPEAEFLCSHHSGDKIGRALEEFRAGRLRLLVTAPIFDEGIDIPQIDALIIAGGGKSVIQTLQRIGRGMRPKAGENRLDVFDFDDRMHAVLARHARARLRICEREGYDVVKLERQTPISQLL